MSTIALFGTGAMGTRIAQKLLDAGHAVTVYNRTPQKSMPLVERGATLAPSPREAARGADVAIAIVTDDRASREIWLDPQNGAVAGLGSDATALESSTLSLAWTQELAAAFAGRGIAFLDAPVVGSRPQAEAGRLIYLVGGREDNLERVRPLLLEIGAAIHHIGPVGQGMAMKLAVNALFGIQVAALGEILGFLAEFGVPAATALSCLGELPTTSLAAKGAGNLILAGNHAPLFPIQLVEKDLRYALQAAEATAASTPLAKATHGLYQQAATAGYDRDNITGIAKLYAATQ